MASTISSQQIHTKKIKNKKEVDNGDSQTKIL